MRNIGMHLMAEKPSLLGEAWRSRAIISGRDTLRWQEHIKLDG